ncbi:hypothetical protein FQA39_LY12712 [Lamprigera yunnana]|nr:hypothetical protein FQA39_LY12712 [Lamprigera yunnana]
MATSLETQDGDLIDLNVHSPVLPRSSFQHVFESSTESLLDTELPVLEEKLQTSQHCKLDMVKNSCVDIEDILITIDDDDDDDVSRGENKIIQPQFRIHNAEVLELCNDNIMELENFEVFEVLTKLDEILNETLEESNNTLSENLEDNRYDSQNETVEDCLEDLDNYLKALEANNCQDCLSESGHFSQSGVLLQSTDDTTELAFNLGQVNLAFKDTEELPSLQRNDRLRATVADIGHSSFQRNAIKRRSLNELHNPSTYVRISGPAVNLVEEEDLNRLQECRSYPPGNCSTGTVVVEPTHNRDTDNHESSWLRSSMRRIRHLRLPSNETPNETEINVTEVNEMVPPPRVDPPQCDNLESESASASLRPFSAPSRLTTHSNVATQSSVRISRESRSNTVSTEPGGRNRSSSTSSRCRRPRSLSSSESSSASSVYSTPSCTPDPAPTRTDPEPTSTTRRPCERSRTNDMPEAESPLGHWPHSLSSLLACLGCTLGLFNISRFAILTIHFGANFILQFFLLSIVMGLPLFTLQLCLGQQLGAGVIDMWKISPLFQGVGVALLASHAFIGLYSIMGVSWLFVYFRDSFITKVDKYRWAEPFYYYRDIKHLNISTNYKLSETVPDYFNGVVLQRHHLKSGSYSGTIKFQLAFNLSVVWMIVFVSLSKGLRSYGKVVYVFSLLPVFGLFVICAKILSLMPSDVDYTLFPETSWSEFFLNSRTWIAASQEVILTWGFLGAATMQIASHNKHKHLLQRDSSLIAILTFAILLMTSFLANTCVQILRSNGYIYLPSSFEKMSGYTFLQSSEDYAPSGYTALSVRYMPHHSFIVGERVKKPGLDFTMESGYQALRFATELVPATFAAMGTDEVYPFWAVLFYFVLILFGIAQQLAIWHCVITGIMAIKAKVLKSWETTITFCSCVFGFLLGLPMATDYGIYMIFFLDYTIGGLWWLILIILLEIVAVFMVRGRPYSGDALVNTFFVSQSRPCLLTWAPALLSFTWNVILPVALMVCCVSFFKNGNFKELFVWHHAPSVEYWPLWARQIGSMMQLLPVLCIPIVAVIQSYRYLNNGPPDILDRIQLLYRPPIGEHMQEISVSETSNNTTTTTTVTGVTATVPLSEDPPPKYTPPPSYTTATGARIAKFLRQSIRRSVRRITNVLGEGSSRPRSNLPSLHTQVPPPDYNAVLVEMNTAHPNRTLSSVNVISARDEAQYSTFSRELAAHRRTSSAGITIADVASILRNSFRRSRIRRNNSTSRNQTVVENNNHASISAENLVDSAAPIGETSLVLDNLSSGNSEAKLTPDNLASVI